MLFSYVLLKMLLVVLSLYKLFGQNSKFVFIYLLGDLIMSFFDGVVVMVRAAASKTSNGFYSSWFI